MHHLLGLISGCLRGEDNIDNKCSHHLKHHCPLLILVKQPAIFNRVFLTPLRNAVSFWLAFPHHVFEFGCPIVPQPTTYHSSPAPNRSGFCSRQATTMTATMPVDSVWNRKTRRVCHLSTRCPLVISSCQLVATSPIVVLSWSDQLVVALPLIILLLCHPLVLLSCQLVVASPLLVLSLLRPLDLSSRQLVVALPLGMPPSCRLVAPPYVPTCRSCFI